MTNLVIVESPAKCGKIQGFLGSGQRVIASLGHIRHLKEELGSVGLDNDFEATWEFMKEKAKAIAALKDAAKSASKVYLAADDDREGELIAQSVCLLLGLNATTTPRAVFHEITETAVKAAVANPRTLDMNKVHAAEARAILDMMVGQTISPLLWKHVAAGASLSAGRCQTPALCLVIDREDEIKSHKPSSSWSVHGDWSVEGSLATWPAALTDELEDEESARAYLENHSTEPQGEVLEAKTTPWTRAPPLPLITSTLQQQVSALFRISPKDTMKIAQRLQEAGHITQMRTDKAVLSEEAVKAAQEQVTEAQGVEQVASGVSKTKATKGKKAASQGTAPAAQEAHEAIRPTHVEQRSLPLEEDWSARDRKVQNLIWLRAIQSTMAPMKGEQRSVTFVADSDDPSDFTWRATWSHTLFDGWRKAEQKDTSTEEAEPDAEEAQWNLAQGITKGMRLKWSKLAADPHETKAPPRYSEATLIQELERNGIGRPSTFASLISTILDREQVKSQNFEAREVEVKKLLLSEPNSWPPEEETILRKVGGEKDRLAPTSLGREVGEFAREHFSDLFNYQFTAQMETRLDEIAKGSEAWKKVLRDTWNLYKDRQTTLNGIPGKSGNNRRREFGEGLIATQTKKGPLLLKESEDGDKDKTVFQGWPEGFTLATLTEADAKAFVAKQQIANTESSLGELDGQPIIKKVGKFGPYVKWNGKTVSVTSEDTQETIVPKLRQDKVGTRIGAFEIREGPQGQQMQKWQNTGAFRKFVSVPQGLNLETITEKELIAVFQAGLQQKARSGAQESKGYVKKESAEGSSSTRGGARGRGRGRGNWRGAAKK